MNGIESPDRGPSFRTLSGVTFYPWDPELSCVPIEDIAHALAHICRWGGHVLEHYSVAQHCVLVSQVVPEGYALAGLLHDAPEAFTGLGDVMGPIKRGPGLGAIKTHERRVEDAFARHFRLPTGFASHIAIKHAEDRVYASEDRDLRGNAPPTEVKPLLHRIVPLDALDAKLQWLRRYEWLMLSRLQAIRQGPHKKEKK